MTENDISTQQVRQWFLDACDEMEIDIDEMPNGLCPVQASGTWRGIEWEFHARYVVTISLGNDRSEWIDYGTDMPDELMRKHAANSDLDTKEGRWFHHHYANATKIEPHPGYMSEAEALVCIAVGFGMLSEGEQP